MDREEFQREMRRVRRWQVALIIFQFFATIAAVYIVMTLVWGRL